MSNSNAARILSDRHWAIEDGTLAISDSVVDPVILMVEDAYECFERFYLDGLDDLVPNIIWARGAREARRYHAALGDRIKVIVVDYMLGGKGDDYNSIPFIKEIKLVYSGPMIASSGLESCRKEQLQAGCTHETEKDGVPQLVRQMLSGS